MVAQPDSRGNPSLATYPAALPHTATIETCEGAACARCKINIDLCQCQPRTLVYRGMEERISGQGWVPQTEIAEAA